MDEPIEILTEQDAPRSKPGCYRGLCFLAVLVGVFVVALVIFEIWFWHGIGVALTR